MNEHAKAWVAALRGGKYTQGQGYLHLVNEPDHYCCLGVACALYQETVGGLDISESRSPASLPKPVISYKQYDHNASYLPWPVWHWLGLANGSASFDPIEGSDQNRQSLAVMNDHGSTFEEIAGVIESEPEGLFV